MLIRWCEGCDSKKPGLMNMLEALNTLVSIIHPSVVTWVFSGCFEGPRYAQNCRHMLKFARTLPPRDVGDGWPQLICLV